MQIKFSLIIFVIIILFSSSEVRSQAKTNESENLFHFAISINGNGTKFFNNDFINSLKQEGLPIALNSTSFLLGSAIYLSSLNPEASFIEVINVGIAHQKESLNNITLNAKSVSSDFNIDFVAWKRLRQYFYPGVGIGWMSYKYNFVNTQGNPNSFPEALENFAGERIIKSGEMAYLNFSANYDWAIDKTNSFLIGIRMNYHLGLNHKNLQLSDGYELAGSPVLKANSLSVGIALTVQ